MSKERVILLFDFKSVGRKMEKEKNVIKFYVLCSKLKDIVRTGWKDWNVERFRVESVAEHIYGVQMLAIAMWSEFQYDLDIAKVLTMLAVHEVEEIVIGDITCFQKSKEEKQALGHKAVCEIFKGLAKGEEIKNLIFEFDERKSAEARFAFFCDKLECDLQSKMYDEQNCVDLTKQQNNKTADDKLVKQMLDDGCSWSKMWLLFGQKRYDYDKNFLAVSNYAIKNDILNQ